MVIDDHMMNVSWSLYEESPTTLAFNRQRIDSPVEHQGSAANLGNDCSRTSNDSHDADGARVTNHVTLRPTFFPSIGKRLPPIRNDSIADLAFVLTGVAPRLRLDQKLATKGRTLRYLAEQPWAKVSPTTELMADHRYVLSPIIGSNESDFRKAWDRAQEALKQKQESVDLAKLSKQLEQFGSDRDQLKFDANEDGELVHRLTVNAIPLVQRLLRATRRRIESVHRETAIEVELSWWTKMKGRLSRDKPVNSVPIDAEVLSVSEHYLSQCVKLGMALRTPLAQRFGRGTTGSAG